MQIEILSVSAPAFVKTARGGYNAIEVAYKNLSKDKSPIEGKKLVDFAAPDVYKILVEAKAGERLNVTSEKGQDGFWKWTSVSGAEGAVGGAPQEAQGAAVDSRPNVQPESRGRVTGSNYETADERKERREFERQKHRQIARQASLNTAVAFYELTKGKPTLDELKATAMNLEDYVFTRDPSVPF